MRRLLQSGLYLAALFSLLGASGQSAAEFARRPERSAGIYCAYEHAPSAAAPAPEGYKPFYISHYGRHGSRWHASDRYYNGALNPLRKAAKSSDAKPGLTPKGRELLSRLERIASDAEGRYGHLTPRGEREHRGIAERMYAAYPEVFATDSGRECRIESRSTPVPRCILSMAAFNERLKELNPTIRITRESGERYRSSYLAHVPGLEAVRKAGVAYAVVDSLKAVRLDPRRLLELLFTREAAAKVRNPADFMYDLYMVASIMQDVDYLDTSLYEFFTPEELYVLWECQNAYRYLVCGPSQRFGDEIIADAKPLLRNFIEQAQEVIDGRIDRSATLRFGHDVNIMPLLALLEVKNTSARVWAADDIARAWNVSEVSPMGTNLQMIFLRNAAGDVRVRVLHNERDAELPLAGGPYYPWKEFRDYCKARYE